MQKIKTLESLMAVYTHAGSLINKGIKIEKEYNTANRPIEQ